MRRSLLLAFMTVAFVASVAACRGTSPQSTPPQAAATPDSFTGTVAEVMNSGGYTYARLQAAGRDDIWIAASEFPAAPGDRLTADLDMPVANFESRTLNRTFPLVYFVSSVSRDGDTATAAAPAGAAALMRSREAAAPTVEPVAPPPGGMSIADIWAKKAVLAGQDVTVRGRVVKVNTQIMGRNWVHLQDGSGSQADGTNDLTITTDAELAVGDTVTMTGVLAAGRDFGSGYVYDVILEHGRIVK
jgi:hypothetical protein